MCGIIGYVGKNNNALHVLIDGLKALEYRGYDSAGIAININNKVKIIKSPGKIKFLEEKINNDYKSNIGIGHTRWATHGEPNLKNSHPHKCGSVTLVHNGIIENYEDIKNELIKQNCEFSSDTDSEVVAALIDFNYKFEKDKLKLLCDVQKKLKGSYALGIIFEDELDTIYAIRKDSPLIIALGKNENYIASDVPAILSETNKYILLDQKEIAVIKSNDIKIYDKALHIKEKEINTFVGSKEAALKNGFEHYMLKEIYDEEEVIKGLVNHYLDNNEKSLLEKIPNLKKYNKIDIVACGSAYHAGLVGKSLLEEFANIPVSVELASEYRYKKQFLDEKSLVILISQSGETADTLAALRIAKEQKAHTLGIINVVSSSIARESDEVLYINAGYEIAVATTKAYQAQISVLSLIAFSEAIRKKLLPKNEIDKIILEYKNLHKQIKNLISNRELYYDVAQKLYNKKNVFFLGRKIDSALCMEASLKLKEISYMHSEAYAAGELKHGTISLIEDKTAVISIISDEKIAEKTISNIKEVIARGADVTVITTDELNEKYKNSKYYDRRVVVPKTNSFIQSLLIAIPFQLIAYEIAKLKGENIDQPRNLAKSVTVE